ncbi:MAG: methyltransferase domain-containing protein [Verrucomicrobiota bacterium]
MRRTFDPKEPEWMDREQPVSRELEEDLANLVSINRWFGSHRLMKKFLGVAIGDRRTARILDLATGSGDLPRLMVAWARSRGIAVEIDAVDGNESTVEIARGLSGDFPEIRWLKGDVLEFRSAASYDLVCCSLALHHFSEEDAVRLLRRCRELSHRFVLVADLERSLGTLWGVRLITALFYRAPMTRADAVASAHRAFSYEEFGRMAERAGWEEFRQGRFLFCRQAIWLDRLKVEEISVEKVVPCLT